MFYTILNIFRQRSSISLDPINLDTTSKSFFLFFCWLSKTFLTMLLGSNTPVSVLHTLSNWPTLTLYKTCPNLICLSQLNIWDIGWRLPGVKASSVSCLVHLDYNQTYAILYLQPLWLVKVKSLMSNVSSWHTIMNWTFFFFF